MSRRNLQPIDRHAQFGARKVAPTAHPSPNARALHERRMNERLQVASQSMPVCNSTTRQPYTGSELRASVRPGSMDAFSLPSVEMGRRIYRKGAI
ncbi:hypothetical protein [Comamonas terrae]|uniref:Uncharacterized protein n=1 Tax=Comamonas terrae TaxID=673548 RepID=A0ABW5UMV1_9BURK|nr:hypothetical protein [Comamonas terrae]